MSLSMKFAEAKLKADLSNYLDQSGYMKTYLTYYEAQEITNTKPLESEVSDKKGIVEKANIKAYLIIESQCDAETRRAYLVNYSSSTC